MFSELSAFGAALRFVFKPFFFVEFLFTFGEDEFGAAIFALQLFIRHSSASLFFLVTITYQRIADREAECFG